MSNKFKNNTKEMEMIDNFLGKHFAGEATSEENQIVEQWSKVNQEEYQKLKFLFENNNFSNDIHSRTYDVDHAWRKVESRLNNFGQDNVRSIKTTKSYSWISIAAMLLITFSGVAWFFLRTIEITTGIGETREIALSDGSIVILGEQSSIAYKYMFSSNRSLKLEGRGFFDVKPDTEHPFRVEGNKFNVTVLGTSFQVTNTDFMKEVTVSTGKVAVKQGQNKITLTPNDRIILTDERFEKEIISSNNRSAWLTKKLVFTNDNIRNVLSELENYYQVDIEVVGNVNATCLYTSTFNDEPLENVLSELKTILKFDYQIEGKNVKIYDLKCK